MDFALIGHFESWDTAAAVLGALRGDQLPPIPRHDLCSIIPWLPPRTLCRVRVRSSSGAETEGIYVDTFIPPDRLEVRFARENVARVMAAAEYVSKEGARVASLGGFSSILLEGCVSGLPQGTRFTTGNTMTVALIVRGVERALALARRDLADATLLIVGATGDVGSGCARYLAPRVRRLLLCARNPVRLAALQDELPGAVIGTDPELLARDADLVISAVSLPSPALLLAALAPDAIVCDAGYPRNVVTAGAVNRPVVFLGGLGCLTGGFQMDPDLIGVLGRHPFAHVAQGCLIEGVVLALEGRFESYSTGRGGITPDRVDEMWRLGERHGVQLAPLHDASGSVEARIAQ